MKKILLALALLIVSALPAAAQGCGPSNPNCIVPTAPAATCDNRAASTQYTCNAINGGTLGTPKDLPWYNATGTGLTDSGISFSVPSTVIPKISFAPVMPISQTDNVLILAGADGGGARISVYLANTNTAGTGNSPAFTGAHANGTLGAPTAILANDTLVSFGGGGCNQALCGTGSSTTGWIEARGSYQVYADCNWSTSSECTRLEMKVTLAGTTTQVPQLTLFNDGALYLGTYANDTPQSGLDAAPGAFLINQNAVTPTALTLASISKGVNIFGLDATAAGHAVQTFGSFGVNTFLRYDGTQASPTPLVSGDEIGRINFSGAGSSSAVETSKARINCWAAENWSTTAFGTYCSIFTAVTGGGSPTVTEKFRFQASGGLSVGNANIATDGGAGIIVGTGFQAGLSPGLTQTCTVNQAKTLIFTLGVLTGGTCNS
jgi:hypothetical protein